MFDGEGIYIASGFYTVDYDVLSVMIKELAACMACFVLDEINDI